MGALPVTGLFQLWEWISFAFLWIVALSHLFWQISGPRDFAWDALAEIASRLRARAFRSGNSSVNPAPAGPFRGVPPFERIPYRGASSTGNADLGSARPGHFRGYIPERFPDRGISSSSMFEPEKSVGYDYQKVPFIILFSPFCSVLAWLAFFPSKFETLAYLIA